MAASRNSPPTDLPARVGDFLAARLAPEEALCVGLSGGCDSVVLLHALVAAGWRARLSALHVHHGLSANADAWAAFCADYCAGLGVPLTVVHVTVDTASRSGLEAAARDARYAAFAAHGVTNLALAQHRGDQAETVLLNLLRGAGLIGAAAMPPAARRGGLRLLRPLLGSGRAELESYARAHGLAWIDDESNADTRLTRNFLRHEVLTAIEARLPGSEAALARAAGHFAEALGLLDELAEQDWQQVRRGDAAQLSGLRELSPARLKNLLRWRLRQLGWQVPVTTRLDEFARQLLAAGPDRHPELRLPGGRLRAGRGLLHWEGA